MADAGPLSDIVCVRGESFAVSGPGGDIEPGGDLGVYVRDTRFLDRLQVRIADREPAHLSGASVGGDRAVFHAYLPDLGDGPDPAVLVTRRRIVDAGLREEITVTNSGAEPLELPVTVLVGTDFAYIFDVKHGHQLERAVPTAGTGVIRFARSGGVERTEVRVAGASADGDSLTVPLTIKPGSSSTVVVEVVATDVYGRAAPSADAGHRVARPVRDVVGLGHRADPHVRSSDSRFTRLVRRSFDDLRSLQLHDPEAPEDRFVAAGSPWFLTLFGRDSIWAAFMALPFDLDLARGTLGTLARRQGTRVEAHTEEQPGKILHEVRRGALAERGDLPPYYFGSIDATPLFVILAHEAWCWGLAERDLRPLLPNVEAALTWMAEYGDPDGDGFLEYASPEGPRGLANQGWKDSHDGVRFADGTIARAPLALCEVQGYAYEAAVRGAELLDRFGRPGGDGWRGWAADLRTRFRAAFWVEDEHGPYPAVALDGNKRPVDSIASNMGHLLATGLLTADEAGHVARRLDSPDLASGWGLRTLSSRSGGYNPLSYHCGAVWPHDTAIAAWGLARWQHAAEATHLLRGLVRAAPRFNFRLPELFAGLSSDDTPVPVPYPTSCRPQAWAAGGALLLVRALLGAEARLPDRRLTFTPLVPAPFERIELEGVPLASGTVDVRWRDGELSVDTGDLDLDVIVDHP